MIHKALRPAHVQMGRSSRARKRKVQVEFLLRRPVVQVEVHMPGKGRLGGFLHERCSRWRARTSVKVKVRVDTPQAPSHREQRGYANATSDKEMLASFVVELEVVT